MNAKKIDELCEFISGLWTGKKPPYINVGVIRNTNFQKNGDLDFTDIALLDVEEKQFKSRQLQHGDIVLEKSGGGPKQPVGRVCVFEKNEGLYSLSNFTSAIRVKNKKELDYKYLHYYLRHLYISGETEKIQTNSTGIRNLQLSLYKEFLVPLPSLATQQKIVTKLDAIFAEIDKAVLATEANIKNSEDLFKSHQTELFANIIKKSEIKNLNQISENWDSKRIPITKSDRKEGAIPYYGASGIVDYVEEFIFDDDILLISEDGANLLARTYPIAFSVSGKSWVNNHAHVVKFSNFLSQKFVEFYLNSISLKPYVSGMAQPKLNQSMLNKIPIPFPTLDDQAMVVSALNSIKESTEILKESFSKKISELSVLKISLLNKAFNGELVKD